LNNFIEIVDQIDDSDIEVFGGKEKVALSLTRLDTSWLSMSKTTLGVMLAVVASSPDKEASRKCLSGMLGMLWKMSDTYRGLLGWDVEPVEQSELMEMSRAVDVSGNELFKKVDGLGMVVMVELLSVVPAKWTEYFQSLIEVRANMTKVLASKSISYLSGMLCEVQKVKTDQMKQMSEKSVFALNSKPAERAREWTKVAGSVFEAVVAGGFPGDVALAEAIKKVGFPSAIRE
jgi:hypothetical protein